MKHLYVVESAEELREYQSFVRKIQDRLAAYLDYLKREYRVTDLPGGILWTSGEIATKLIGSIPVPAYTNEKRIVMCPNLETWRDIYLRQLDGLEDVGDIRSYYQNGLSENHVMQILGHELAHHSEHFPESDYEEGIWFEEGMVEYISRRYFLTDEEFDREAEMNRKLVERLETHRGIHSIEAFGKQTYEQDYAGIFFEYWRSFLAVNSIIEEHRGDVQEVFRKYRDWFESGCGQTLESWFRT